MRYTQSILKSARAERRINIRINIKEMIDTDSNVLGVIHASGLNVVIKMQRLSDWIKMQLHAI